MLSAVIHGGPAREIVFTGFLEGAFVLHSCYVFVCGLPALLAIVECLFASTSLTLSCLHRVTLVSVFPLIYQCKGAWWLLLPGLPWIPASLACIIYSST